MKISIIVPAYNEGLHLLKNLTKINNSFQFNDFYDYEFIICDNNSTDNTSIIANEFGAKVIFEPINQISKARNTGAKIATGEWLVFIDADSWPSRYLIRNMLDQIYMNKVIGGSSLIQFASCPLWWRATWKLSNFSMPLFDLTPTGAFMFCKKSTFHEIGGFDEELFALEDLDFSRKLRNFGRLIDKKFTIIKQPTYTSSRRVNDFKPRDIVKLAVLLSKSGKSTLKNKNNFLQWYSRK